MSAAKATTNHDEIRRWVEARGGRPAVVKGTGRGKDPGILRIDYPGYAGEDTLKTISWDDWTDAFEKNKLALLMDPSPRSRFSKLVSRDSIATASRGSAAKRTAAKRSTGKRSAAKRGSAKRATAKRSTAKRAAAPKQGAVKRTTAKRASTAKSTAKRGSATRTTKRPSTGRSSRKTARAAAPRTSKRPAATPPRKRVSKAKRSSSAATPA